MPGGCDSVSDERRVKRASEIAQSQYFYVRNVATANSTAAFLMSSTQHPMRLSNPQRLHKANTSVRNVAITDSTDVFLTSATPPLMRLASLVAPNLIGLGRAEKDGISLQRKDVAVHGLAIDVPLREGVVGEAGGAAQHGAAVKPKCPRGASLAGLLRHAHIRVLLLLALPSPLIGATDDLVHSAAATAVSVPPLNLGRHFVRI